MTTFMPGSADPFSDVPAVPRHLGSRILETVGGELWRPASDVYETEDGALVAHIDLPGVPRHAIIIDTNDMDEITVHGEAPQAQEFQAASSRVRERNIGKFRKILRMPPGCDYSNIKATYKDGLLEIRVPRTAGGLGPSKVVPIH
ncbi:hypothetical protein H9P43_004158 [Blastocladiella emersonii ATCC 22665]|uniref:Heat shock protein 16 n=1 Tax=Blastocladiella emersonii TaxID=4808 RepID=A0A6M5WNZ0_BLAEM|nr:hypothetical protein H9P43_004158 [Blastocladiella emersonii ATCC 22665]QJW70209.1 heat shock protein 16 [Blastocladiella emersonii]